MLLFSWSSLGIPLRTMQQKRMRLPERLLKGRRKNMHRHKRVRIKPGYLQRRRNLRQHGRKLHVFLPARPHSRRHQYNFTPNTLKSLLTNFRFRNAMFGRTTRTVLHAIQARKMHPSRRRSFQQKPLLLFVYWKSLGRKVRSVSQTRNVSFYRIVPARKRFPRTKRHKRMHRVSRNVPKRPLQEHHRKLQLSLQQRVRLRRKQNKMHR